ncbi:gamma-interferon-inducible lysosomal thiol reductase [Scaptodrosophila lebanonensis]|uniref:Gamma-interferon-inducible lysosomal thiol reductase n=1 Tax=Drosophila lebanonensis TaxID=7225 RepID=A0A6J2U4F6_DROLE|nr:gamma-interferon-inducible lysosomal thiol reductase [Scaptodrosophila lebanonensis]
MIPTRKRIFIFIFIIAVVGLLIRILLFNTALETPEEINYHHAPLTPVVVRVFYEALCPDSKYFITRQLLPTYVVAASIMEVELIPYGKATTNIDASGNLSFDCQHGPKECEGNMYHACVAEAVEDPMVRLEIVTCMIRDNHIPKDAMHKCVKQYNIENIDLIQKCFDSTHGAELLKLHGDATHALRPPVSFIPTVTLNGTGRQASILKDLLSEVCKVAGKTEQTDKICKHRETH